MLKILLSALLASIFMSTSNLDNIRNTVYQQAINSNIVQKHIVTVVDFTLPYTADRLFVYDMDTGKLLMKCRVAQGIVPGFSNRIGSHQSSLGVYKVLGVRYGRHGQELEVQGLERGFNDNAYNRVILVHSTLKHWSWGCFAVPIESMPKLIPLIKNGTILIAYYPDKTWLDNSKFLK